MITIKPTCTGLESAPVKPDLHNDHGALRPALQFGFTIPLPLGGDCEAVKRVSAQVNELPTRITSQVQQPDCETIEALAVLRGRICGPMPTEPGDTKNGFAWLQSHQGQPNALPNGAHLLRELILKEYLPAIRRWRDRLGEDERAALAVSYARKLDDTDDETFERLVPEYLVAEDIANPRLLQDLLDRVTFWTEEEHG